MTTDRLPYNSMIAQHIGKDKSIKSEVVIEEMIL